MRIIAAFLYFLVFLVLAIVVMFLGGVSGVVGAFHIMVQPGDLQSNITTVVSILFLIWLLLMVLRYYNKKAIKYNKQLQLKAAEQEDYNE